MTEQEKELIMSLVVNTLHLNEAISKEAIQAEKEKFYKQYPVDIKQNTKYLLHVLQQAYTDKDAETIEYALMLQSFLDTPMSMYRSILADLLQADWHELHEQILDTLISMESPQNINIIFDAILRAQEGNRLYDSETISVKGVWALGKLKSKEAAEKIRELLMFPLSDYVRTEANKSLGICLQKHNYS